ncbi:Venom allergen 5.02 [Eumeta japonica]|uniref:Venom allergen 5.02 n=1 Tax=Eumeta variegata TaxID=151549 RepID=A0A4C1WT70_EUMVA|nr:Venom allergen 5.02 [Eumeta japonica]
MSTAERHSRSLLQPADVDFASYATCPLPNRFADSYYCCLVTSVDKPHLVYKVTKLSCEQVQRLVEGHNSRRLRIAQGDVPGQPAATDMTTMIWDEELAMKASRWARRGQFNHNPDRTIDSGRFETGENLYIYRTTDESYELDVDQALEDWFDEYKDFEYGPMTSDEFSDPDRQIGHYTQMVWSNSTFVGCGMSQTRKSGSTQFLVVCNYGPQGNIIGEPPYQTDGAEQYELQCGAGVEDCDKKYGDEC